MFVLLAVFLAASVAIPLLARVMGVRAFVVAALVPAAAFVYTVAQAPAVLPDGEVVERVEWIPSLGITLDMRMDALSWLLSLVVTGVGALVLLYCARYFRSSEEGLGRFAGLLVAFAGVMFGLVLADDVFVLFTFWEATSVLSYLLIGHYTGKKASRGAALQALLVTTAGGLAMLVGLVILSVAGGTTSLAALVADPPGGQLIPVAVVLILLGALSKSALVPFHFWLPAAMAAPTPVSAYLHAAAMVKAGIYLVARLAPGYADVPGWRVLLVSLGVATMLVGGWRALKQMDLKLVLAYGTVSQLGFLTVVVGYGTRDAALAGVALLLAHALFKATLFLVVGVVDHRAGTRDLRKISGLGRKAPVLAVIAALALASMAGLPPFLGFVAKEAVLTALLTDAELGGGLGWVALVGVSVGSCLTVAYSARFMWGAFARKRGVDEVQPVHEHLDFLVPPAVLAATGLVLGFLASSVDEWIAGYADTLPAVSAGAAGEPDHTYHLALWHGIEPALLISAGTLVVGLIMFRLRDAVFALQSRVPSWIDAARIYWASMRLIDRVAARTTATTQRGSLPFYLGVILLVLIGSVGSALALNRSWPTTAVPFDHPAQPVIGIVMIVAAIAAARAGKRFQAVVLVGVTGYGMAALFALHGAPDLALTQVLIETITLVAFVLVLRRLPVRLGERNRSVHPIWRASIGIAVAVLMSTVAVVALGARVASPISLEFPRLAYEQGHGSNVVNVTLVDLRGWDTMGEISVLIVAATGVASLIFLNRRTDSLPRLTAPSRRSLIARLTGRHDPQERQAPLEVEAGTDGPRMDAREAVKDSRRDQRSPWLLAGRTLAPQNRSILLEVVVRLLFHSLIVVSVYLLFSGHNLPGGGFAGGLLAGMALVARYLAGGRYELGAAAPVDAGRVLGTGLVFAVGTAIVPLVFGADALTSTWIDTEVPFVGHVEFVTSTFFDVGVYLVVVGLTLDVLRSLGAEVDRQEESDRTVEQGADGMETEQGVSV
ncbi:Na+/H+ antiporter subunit A [Clavibacter sp. VKM Ac-2542]|uniref:Na+/H+ antiporter subunit A n=1 Tax=Clavibacter sp. VKM Ac-2542 TaxID=2783811 RepID=UPI00188A0580|nr:Na+/H+ antiporter subunit A [Clavibacter sp. VKM Ac-2542]MBF4620436.1 Na+/H+ antiporter subunit A [Clavibacter sp. VKM Ac-2542]